MKKQAIAFVTMAATVFTLSAGAFSQTPDQGPSKPLGTGAIPKHVAGTRISGASAKPASVLATDLGARLTPEITSTYRFITDWSQDGKLITYGQNGDIYIVPAAGGEPVNITNVTSGECFAPSFTPDSASIVFTWWDGLNNTSYEVDAINISTRKVTVLYDLAALGVMSRDGKYLVFRSLAGDLCVYDTTKYSLNVINSGDQAYGYIAISPDNSTIVTTMNTSDGDKRLFSIPLLGGAPKQLTFHAGEHEYPEFSPDGKWVLYTNWDDATTTSQIQALDLSTGTSKYIWDTAVDAWCASFAPGGKRFAYLLYNEDNKAYDLYAADFPYAAALAALRVVSPNGGEQWPAGSTQMIKWEGPATAKVEYSTDNGSTWIVLPNPATTLANRYEWVVPNTLSTKCLVKVSTLSGDASDKSDAVFSIVSASASSLTLTSPNGGEFWKAGSVQFIKWQASGVAKVQIDYSIDGGTTWTAIATGADATTGMFSWTLPNVSSTKCLVRITDTSNTTLMSKSAGTFEISKPSITVTAPNGGDVWTAGTQQKITWGAGGVDSFNIEYTTDGGTTWMKIAGPVPAADTNAFDWTVPATPSEKCFVRVSDANNSVINDVSDIAFAIKLPTSVTVTAPNGGEKLVPGKIVAIAWTFTGLTELYLEYSPDGGANWKEIAGGVKAADGSYAWVIPDINSTNCLVRVSNSYDMSVRDQSDAVFTIAPAGVATITVTSPNAGEIWQAGTVQNITWTSTAVVNVKIDYSTNNGSSWVNIVATTPANAGTFAWTIPTAINSTNCRVRVTATANSAVTDASDAVFSIFPASNMPKVTVVSPNSGGKYVAGDYLTIIWTATNVKTVNIRYSIDGGAGYQWVAQNVDATKGQYTWILPSVTAEYCKIWIYDSSNLDVGDTSDGTFSIVIPAAHSIKVLSPNGGEQFTTGSVQTISWSAEGIAVYLVEVSTDGGTTWTTLPASAIDGSAMTCKWTTPATASSRCLVRVSDANDATVSDTSDAAFSVTLATETPKITVTSPNGGENWQSGSSRAITWTSSGLTNVKIDYTVNDGSTWASVVSSTAASTGSFSWTIPSTINSTNCRIRISDAGNSAAVDASDAVFTIAPAVVAKITVTVPNGGEIWQAGSSQTIKWTSTGVSLANIEFSPNGGTTWTSVAENVNSATGTGNYPFTAPSGLVSSNCLVRVTDAKNANVTDASDAPFSIQPAPFINVTSPVGGETWGAGTVNPITFKAFGVKTLKFEYSTDNRTTWNVIADKVDITTLKVISSAASVNSVPEYSFSWTLPNLAAKSDLCFVRIVDMDDVTHIDRNQSAFTISPNVAITLTRPVGGETLYAGTKSPVTWTASAAVSTVDIFYSTDSGGSWTAVATAVGASAGTYAWVVPAVNSVTCRVRVIDTATKAASSSLRDFTIKKPSITVLSPNGGETIVSGSRTTITWKAEGVDRVSISYSTDGGSTSTVIEPDIDASTGFYSWTVPSVSSSNCRVIVKSTTLASLSDTSDAAFTIQSNAWITLLDPNGGEKFYAGQTVTIRWRSQNVSKVSMAFSVDTAGKEYTIIAENVDASSGSFEWVVPGVYTPTGLIVIWDSSNTDVYDGCDAFFTTLQPSITLKYPNGGETFTTGDKVNIQWESVGLGTIEIIYSTDNFSTNQYISPGADATRGSYEWIVPDINSSTVLIAIGTSYFDISDNFFTVRKGTKPYLQLTAPNGGQIWQAGSSQTISWTASNSSSLKIDYSTDGGVSWNLVAGGVNSSLQSYSWTVPGAPSQNCKVRITDLSDATVSDASDGLFTIVESTTAFISVSTPGTGDRLTVGSKREIKWNTSGVSNVKIEFSIDNGTTWETVVESVSAAGGSYQWTVPDKKSNKCLIRVSDTTKPSVTGSSGMFEIMQPEIMIAHTPITQAKENDKITFTAEVTGVTSPVVELKYDVTGRRVFDKTKVMTKVSGNTYSCFLDVGVFTAEGMEYAIVARDPDNVSIRTTSPDQGYYCVRAEVTEMTSPYSVTGGSLQNAYRMVSIPLQLNKKTITEQITRLPDGAMGTEWRLFRFSPGENDPKEYPNIEGFSPGIAFWLISTSSFQLKTPDGVAVTTSENFTIELKPGWNDIANPWMFDISWNDIENPSSANISKPYAYEGSWSDPTSAGSRILKPWTGYAVKNMESRNVIIRLVPKKAVSAQKEALLDGDLVWSLSLSARVGLASDTANGFGVRRSASPAWDENDHVEPPAIGQYVTVTFPHRDWARYPSDYTVDFRPPGGDLSWDFDVRTNIAHERVKVAVDGLAELPSGVTVSVIDRDTGKAVQCADGSFTFMSGEGLTERRFTLKTTGVEGPGRDTDARPAAFVTTRAYPNPFNPRTVIRYELSEPGYVVLSVFNTVGQLVRQEHLGRRERGVHEYVFDAARLTSGLYVYRVDAGFSSATDKMLFMK